MHSVLVVKYVKFPPRQPGTYQKRTMEMLRAEKKLPRHSRIKKIDCLDLQHINHANPEIPTYVPSKQ